LDIFVLLVSIARAKLSESVGRKMAANGQGISNPVMPFPKAWKITRGTVSEEPVDLRRFKSAQAKKTLTLWPLNCSDVRQKKVISLPSNPAVFQGMKFGQDPLKIAPCETGERWDVGEIGLGVNVSCLLRPGICHQSCLKKRVKASL